MIDELIKPKEDSKVFLSISGGKDSTAMLLFAIEHDIKFEPFFIDTGNEHPLIPDYLSYLENALNIKISIIKASFDADIEHKREIVQTKWRTDGVSENKISEALAVLNPTGNPFLDLCLAKGRFPSFYTRFCSERLKRDAFYEQVIMPALDVYSSVESWQGIRADESPKRASYPQRDTDDYGFTKYFPIFHWNVNEVIEIHKKHGIKPNPLYFMGMMRVGCFPCIYVNQNDLRQLVNRFPEMITKLKEWEALVSAASKKGISTYFDSTKVGSRKGQQTLPMDIETVSIKINEAKLIGNNLWTMNSSAFQGCSSVYGLCGE